MLNTQQAMASVSDPLGNEQTQAGMNNAVQLATAAQQMDLKKSQLQQQQMDVDAQKNQHYWNSVSQYASTDPKLRDTVKDQMLSDTAKYGMDAQLSKAMAVIDSDPEMGRRANQAIKTALANGTYPDFQKTMLMQAQDMMDLGNQAGAQKTMSEYGKYSEGLAAKQLQVAAMQSARQDKLDEQAQRFIGTMHDRNMRAVDKDTTLTALTTSKQNIQNAFTLFQSEKTPQAFQEWQQALRSNAGIKGSSGVAEREASYYKSVGLTIGEIKQKLSGSPADVNEIMPKLVAVTKSATDAELQNKDEQGMRVLKALSAGRAPYYAAKDKNGIYTPAYEEKLNAKAEQFGGKEQFSVNGGWQKSTPDTETTTPTQVQVPDAMVTSFMKAHPQITDRNAAKAQLQRVLSKVGGK